MTEVEVYTTPTCPYCTKLKNWLKDEGIEFEEVDLSENQEAARKLVRKTGERGVPQTIIRNEAGEKAVVGFRPERIRNMVGEEGR